MLVLQSALRQLRRSTNDERDVHKAPRPLFTCLRFFNVVIYNAHVVSQRAESEAPAVARGGGEAGLRKGICKRRFVLKDADDELLRI